MKVNDLISFLTQPECRRDFGLYRRQRNPRQWKEAVKKRAPKTRTTCWAPHQARGRAEAETGGRSYAETAWRRGAFSPRSRGKSS